MVGFLIDQVLLCKLGEPFALVEVEHREAVLDDGLAVLIDLVHVGDDVLAELLVHFLVDVRLAVFLDDEVVGNLEAVLHCQVLGQALYGLFAAVVAEAGLHAFKQSSCAVGEGELALLENGKLSPAVFKLAFGCRELFRAGCKILTACRELSFALRQSLFRLCKLLLAGFKLCKAVLILLELSLAVCNHLIDVCGEIGHVCGDIKAETCAERTDDGNEPDLCAVKAGELCDGSVTELDVQIQVRQQGLDLCELFLALVVSLSVGVYLCLALCQSLLAGLVSGIALCQGLFTGRERRLTGGIVALALGVLVQAVGIGAYTGEIGLLIFPELGDACLCGLEIFSRKSCVSSLILLDIQNVTNAGDAGEQSEYARKDKDNAEDHK